MTYKTRRKLLSVKNNIIRRINIILLFIFWFPGALLLSVLWDGIQETSMCLPGCIKEITEYWKNPYKGV